jgi:hypothetical protein
MIPVTPEFHGYELGSFGLVTQMLLSVELNLSYVGILTVLFAVAKQIDLISSWHRQGRVVFLA